MDSHTYTHTLTQVVLGRKHLTGSKMLKLNKVETIEQNLCQQSSPSHFLGNREVV